MEETMLFEVSGELIGLYDCDCPDCDEVHEDKLEDASVWVWADSEEDAEYQAIEVLADKYPTYDDWRLDNKEIKELREDAIHSTA